MGDRIGQQFGHYRLIRLLGRGGFAEVYLGEHIHIQTQVAIKVLSTQLVAKDLERFIREARTIASFEHPHIVHVFDFGIQDEIPFLVMHYASNGTLRQRHPQECRVPLNEVLSYVQPIASALQYAHDRKVIHRDVKPENMLLGSQSEVLLSDFGIAVTTATSTSRETKTTAGTVAYMAPEQIMGKPCIASDQYALGIVVYEWLSGKQPFHGSFFEMCAQHLHAPLPSLRETNPEISREVERCITKALSKDPEKRFASIQDFATALQERSDLAISVFTSTPAQQPSAEKLPDSHVGQEYPTVLTPQQEQPIPSEIGQDDPTVLTPQPKMPVPSEIGPNDPTVLRPQPDVLVTSAQISQDDSAAHKLPLAASKSFNDDQVDANHIKPDQTDPALLHTYQDLPTLPKEGIRPIVHVTAEPTSIPSTILLPSTQRQRPGQPRRATKKSLILIACIIFLLLLVTTPFLFSFLHGILFVRTGNPTHLGSSSIQHTVQGNENNTGDCPLTTGFVSMPSPQSMSELTTPLPTSTSTGLTPTPIPTPTPTPTPGSRQGPTPTPTPRSISTPTSLPVTSSLTAEIASTMPNSVTNGKTVQVDVNTNEPDVTVYLSVTYSYQTRPSSTTHTQAQTTNGQGKVTISWCVEAVPSGTSLPSGTTAQVQAIAQDQQGHQVQSDTVTVMISRN